MQNKQRGFSILELFISLAVGLVLLAGVLSVFVSMKTTTKQTSTYGELQENGRFALSVLTDDLLRQDFWGDYSGTFDRASLSAVPAAPTSDCTGDGVNNATFPVAAGHFRTLWGDTITSASMMSCITDAKVGTAALNNYSDIIQLKRVISTATLAADIVTNQYYLNTNLSEGEVFTGGDAIPNVDNSQIWQYQHHIYYVREETQGSISVPVLMQGRLSNKAMLFVPIIDGIEMIRFMYGVDTTDDGVVNAFISADNMTQALWNNAANSKIIAIKVYILARSITPDIKYTNTNSYLIGDETFTANDNYRRLLFSSTITLFNARVDQWN
jgi:type IV pilus assembly protein PilW